MKKAVSDFIFKEDLDNILIPNWRDKISNNALIKAVNNLNDIFNSQKSDKENKNIDNYIKVLGIPDSQKLILQIEISIIKRNLKKEDSNLEFLYPVIDSVGVCHGYLASYGNLRQDLAVDSPLDNLLQKEWDVKFKRTELQGAIYPCSGMIYYETNPNTQEWIKELNALPGETLDYFQAKEIFYYICPGEQTKDVVFYYKTLKENGVLSTISLLPFVVLKELRLLKDGIKFEDYHKMVSQSYIEF